MQTLFSIYAFVVGTMVGSLLNVVIHRIPLGESIVLPSSKCPKCSNKLKWYHNIPILSYIFLRGKCSYCKTSISPRYPLVELTVGIVAYLLFPDPINHVSMAQFGFFFSVFCALFSLLFIDIKHHILPDKINLFLFLIILSYVIFYKPLPHWIIGGLAGFGSTFFITWLFYKLRGQIGLGGGDIKLYGILGMYLGVQGIFMNIFMSCFLGALVGITLIANKKMSRDTPMAFGPYIILVGMAQIFFPDQFNQIITGFFFPS
jgi:leader peptidase (prepilin peptidase)/N-methyltransferase